MAYPSPLAVSVSLIFCLVSRVAAHLCDSKKDCGSCLEYKELWSHACHWCEIDEGCHAVGSLVSPCAPAEADNDCISASRLSGCSKKSETSCAADSPLKARQVHISLAGSNAMRVAWKTNGAKPDSASVVFSEAGVIDGSERTVLAERSVQYLSAQDGHGYHHVAKLTDLKSGTKYEYHVVNDGVASSARSFQTESEGLSEASLLIVADMGFGANGQAIQSRHRMEAVKRSTNLTIHAGDIGYADDSFLHTSCSAEFCYESIYDKYMEWIENVTDTKPYMVAPGNHESECHSPACVVSPEIRDQLRNFSAYNARWAMPSPESGGVANMWYSFDYASVHFVAINTETDFADAPEMDYGDAGKKIGLRAGHFAPEGAYRSWLEADLKAANQNRAQRPWVVAFGHRPWVFFNGSATNAPVQKAHADLFEKYGVDLLISGHVHSYHRLLPIGGNTAVPTIVSGGAGCDEFASDRHEKGEFDAKGKNELWDYRYFNKDTQIGVMNVSRSELTFTAIASSTGEVIDVLTLKKSEAVTANSLVV